MGGRVGSGERCCWPLNAQSVRRRDEVRRSRVVITNLTLLAACFAASLQLTSCSFLRLDPVTAEQRRIAPTTDESRTVVVLEPMVWMNAPEYRASKGVRLPMGVYTLVAEDSDYLYFQSPNPIEMRVLERGVPVDGQDFSGGLALAKRFSMVPAATYIDVNPDDKMLVMKHGGDFLQMEGRQWKKSW